MTEQTMGTTDDIVAIPQLVVRERESRDLGYWNRMLDCFHPDAEINISWIHGSAREFVEGSKDMAARGMLAKHRLGPVHVTLNGKRALASLSGIIDIPTLIEGKEFSLSSHCLMLYKVEQRSGLWRLASFEVIYRRDEFIPAILGQTASLPADLLAQYRPSYRNLCYSLHLKGYTPNLTLAGEDRPDTVKAIFTRLYGWLGLPIPD
ncbi:MAG: nuclear transport factor 2 family protein [Burkholderiaceae bacterium]